MKGRAEILLVEDETDLRQDLSALLVEEGFRVTTAKHGAEALAILEREAKPWIILLDLMMPVMDGWEMRARQRANPALARIPVVILSGLAEDDTQVGALDAMAYVTKPISVGRLVRVLNRVIELGETQTASSGARI